MNPVTKTTLPILYFAIACSLGAWPAASAIGQTEKIATIKKLAGEVRLEPASTPIVAPGAPVFTSQQLVTGKSGMASLVMQDGSTLTIGPGSELKMSQFQFNATTQQGSLAVQLVKGTLHFITGLIGKTNPERVRISTSTATIGIRGTDFIVEAQ
jgi:hypothetical protein